MITKKERAAAVRRVLGYFKLAGIPLGRRERGAIEVADFGLSELETTGLQLLTYVNTKRCCAKELVLFPGQTCPEHRHPPHMGSPGKEETFRCRLGKVFLYVPGPEPSRLRAVLPDAPKVAYTAFREVLLKPGDQFTLPPNTRHWFQAGPQGAVVSEFSSPSHDASDIFSDPRVRRTTMVV